MFIQGFSAFLSLFLFSFSHASTTTSLVDRIEASINKKAIYLSDVKKFNSLIPLRIKVDPFFVNDPVSKGQPSKSDILSYLISETIMLEKFPVSDAEVDQEINSIQSHLRIDRAALKSALSREGFAFKDYQDLMRASIAKKQLIEREIRNKAIVSDDEIKTEYNRNRSGSKNFNGSVHLSLIKITKANYKTLKDAKNLYDQALAKLKNGAAFDLTAKETSDDSSASSGGDLGYLAYHDMNPSLQAGVQKILSKNIPDNNKVGSYEDKNAFVIFKVLEISKDVDSGFNKEKEAIRGKLLEKEFQHQINLWIDRQKALLKIKIYA